MIVGILIVLGLILVLTFIVIVPFRVAHLQIKTAREISDWFVASGTEERLNKIVDDTPVEFLNLDFERKMLLDIDKTLEEYYNSKLNDKKMGVFKTIDRATFESFKKSKKTYYVNKMIRKRHING